MPISLQQALQDSHADLQQWFLIHQECLLLGHDSFAETGWQMFCALLENHIHFENDALLSAHDGQPGLRWPTTVYRKEHDKLLTMMAQLSDRLQEYHAFAGRYRRLALLELLDAEFRFQHVMAHHEQREEQDLFPVLASGAGSDRLLQQWQDSNQPLQQRAGMLLQRLQDFLSGA